MGIDGLLLCVILVGDGMAFLTASKNFIEKHLQTKADHALMCEALTPQGEDKCHLTQGEQRR